MKKIFKKSLALFCALALSVSLLPQAMAEEPTVTPSTSQDFAVLSTTDVHGKCWDKNLLNDTDVKNSLLNVSTAVQDIRSEYNGNVVLIDNGDLYQGTPVSTYHISQLTKGEVDTPTPMALCLKYIGYDVSVLGNHEFNYPWSTMNKVYTYLEGDAATTGYNPVPVVSANLYYDGSDGVHTAGENVFTPYVTKTLTVAGQEIKIGILGIENTDCTRWDIPDNYPGIVFADPANTDMSIAWEVNKYVPQMKAAGCDFVIVSYHSGLGSDDGSDLSFGANTENQALRMINESTDVDMVITGHDHSSSYSNTTYPNKDGSKDVLVVNAGGTDLTESVFTVTVDANGTASIGLKENGSQNLKLANYAVDTDLKALIQPYATVADTYVNQDCGTVIGDWNTVTKFYLEQSDTIDLINRSQIAEGSKYLAQKYNTADKQSALYASTGLDHLTVDASSTSVVVSDNYNVKAGPLTMKNIYQFYKYDNTLYLLPLTGQQIKDVLEFNAENRLSAKVSSGSVTYSTIGDSFTNPVFYGLDFQYDMAQEPGSRVVDLSFSDGRALELDKTYILAVNNYHLGNGPFANYSTSDAIWSQTDDLGGGVVQDLIKEFVGEETTANGGVSPAPSGWSLTYSGSLEDDLGSTQYVAYATDAPKAGDTVVIYNTGNAIALGTNMAGTAPTVKGTTLYGDNTVTPLTVGVDGSDYTFASDGKYLSAANGTLSLSDTLDDNAKWTLEADGAGVYHIVNKAAPAQYLETYQGKFTTYKYSAGSDGAYAMKFYTVVPTAEKQTTVSDGDQVVLYYDNGGQIVGSTANGSKLSGVESTPAGNQLPVYAGSAVFDVSVDGDGYYTFTCNGKYLTSGATGNSLTLADAASEYSLWEPQSASGGWFVRNVNAAYNGNANQYLEYYSGFTTYGKTASSNPALYTFNFYKFNGFTDPAPEEPSNPDAYVLPVFETSDVHGFLVDTSSGDASTYQYRMAYIAKVVNTARNGNNDNTVLLDGGDIYQGNAVSNLKDGAPMMEAYDAMGYDAVGLGNHEFDWGIYTVADHSGTITTYTSTTGATVDSQIPILACNVYDRATGNRADFTQDYVILNKVATNADGDTVPVKVAVVGYVPDYSSDIMAARIEPYELRVGVSAAEDIAKTLKSEGKADAAILLVHASSASTATSLSANSPFDLVLGGHTHQNENGTSANGVAYLQVRNQAQAYARTELQFSADGKFSGVDNSEVISTTGDKTQLYESAAANLDSDVLTISKAAITAVAPVLNDVLGYIETPVTKAAIGDNNMSSNAGNWMTNLQNESTGSDVGITNNGGIRTEFTIPTGSDIRNVTAGDIYTIAPFGNILYVYQMTYTQLKDLLEECIKAASLSLRMSGIQAYYTGTTITTLIKDNTVIYDNGTWESGWADKTVKVSTNEYVATALDAFKNMNDTNQLLDHTLVDNEAFLASLEADAEETGGLLYVDPNPYFINGTYTAHTHDYSSVVHAPTATRTGYTYHECSVCGRSYIDNIVKPTTGGGSSGGGSSSGGSVTAYTITVTNVTGGTVKANRTTAPSGAKVTLTVAPTDGYTLSTLVVTRANGEAVTVTKNADGTYGFTQPAGAVTVTPTFVSSNGLPFTDIGTNPWYEKELTWAYQNSIINGTSATTFSPNATTTRGMVVTILYRLSGETTASTTSFSDVPATSAYAQGIAWAKDNGVATGFADGTFGLNQPITRQQMAAFLYRYAQKYAGLNSVTTEENLSSYTDASSVAAYAISAMNWAVGQGIIQGDNNQLMPTSPATRAQTVVMLSRFDTLTSK